ncbi:hypothetical protein SF23_04515 [Streptomyces sp. MBRL 10]|nr:hypothetical protein SF23_04515 [Streptomyces sp. MBRL 10]
MAAAGTAGAAGASRDLGHAGERADAGASGQSQQDGFRLIVPGVAEQDGGRAEAVGGLVQAP